MKIGILASNSTHLSFPGSVSSRARSMAGLFLKRGHEVVLYCLDYRATGLGVVQGAAISFAPACELRFFDPTVVWEEQQHAALQDLLSCCDVVHSVNVFFKAPGFPVTKPVFIDINYPVPLFTGANIYHLALCDDFVKKYPGVVYGKYIPLYPCEGLAYSASGPANYLLWLGRLNPEKEPERLLELADHVALPIYVGGIQEPQCQEFGARLIDRFERHPNCNYLGFVRDGLKKELLQQCKAVLYTTAADWSEASGTVFFEAMKCGKAVVGQSSRFNAIKDYVAEGLTGYVCNTLDEMRRAVEQLDDIDSAQCVAQYERLSQEDAFYESLLRIYRSVL